VIRFLAVRLAVAVPTVFVVVTLTFLLLQLIPGNPASFILGAGASKEQIAALTQELGLDRPLPVQYVDWMRNAVQGDFGQSSSSNMPAIDAVLRALPVTLSVAVVSLFLTIVLGIGLGLLAAVKEGFWDRLTQGLCSLAMAVPVFWLAALLIYLLAIKTDMFYATDYVPLTESPQLWILHVMLPALAIGLTTMGQVAFHARASFRDVLTRDFLRTLRATGLSRRRILVKHVLRNGLIPVVTVLGMTFVFMLGGVVIIEAIFSLPGLGALMIQSVNTHDVAVVQTAVVAFTILVIAANLITDLMVAGLDPRARA